MSLHQGLNAMRRDTEVESLQLRLATLEQHAELIKMNSSPLLPSPLLPPSPLGPLVVPRLMLDEPSEPAPVPNESDTTGV